MGGYRPWDHKESDTTEWLNTWSPWCFFFLTVCLAEKHKTQGLLSCCCCLVTSDSLRPHGLQHARLPCPSPSPGVYSSSCPLSRWCHPTTSSLPSWIAPFMNQDCLRRITFPIAKPQRISAPGISLSAGQGCSWQSSQQGSKWTPGQSAAQTCSSSQGCWSCAFYAGAWAHLWFTCPNNQGHRVPARNKTTWPWSQVQLTDRGPYLCA